MEEYELAISRLCTNGYNEEDFSSEEAEFDYKNKYVVNHTEHCGFSLDNLPSDDDGYVIYPISLLTAIGNGRGGGDYWKTNKDYDLVGSWAFDEISIEDEIPSGYVTVSQPQFIEQD